MDKKVKRVTTGVSVKKSTTTKCMKLPVKM